VGTTRFDEILKVITSAIDNLYPVGDIRNTEIRNGVEEFLTASKNGLCLLDEMDMSEEMLASNWLDKETLLLPAGSWNAGCYLVPIKRVINNGH